MIYPHLSDVERKKNALRQRVGKKGRARERKRRGRKKSRISRYRNMPADVDKK